MGDSGGVDDSDKLFNYTYSPALEDDTSENNTSLQALTTYDYLLYSRGTIIINDHHLF